MKITITPETTGERLDKFLTFYYSDLSRSRIQKLITSGQVAVNGKPADPAYRLKQEEIVEFPEEKEIADQEDRDIQKQKKKLPQVEIISEAPGYVVVNKPAGLISHRVPHIREPALTDILVESYPEMAEVGEDEWRPGLLHRLDREASGLLVAARDQENFYHLKEQFQSRRVKKEYTCLVHGTVEKDEGKIDFPIKRSDKGFKMAAMPRGSEVGKNAREAETYFWVLSRRKNFTLLKVRIHTGRTHQIRTHLAAFGYPVAGDIIYGHKKTKPRDRRLREQGYLKHRIFLVADVLRFRDVNNQNKEFSLDFPGELKDLWEALK